MQCDRISNFPHDILRAVYWHDDGKSCGPFSVGLFTLIPPVEDVFTATLGNFSIYPAATGRERKLLELHEILL
jgi:hypothetical protein